MENLSKLYLDQLEDTKNPGFLLSRFFCDAVDTTLSQTLMRIFSKLVKMYGRVSVFRAIIEISTMENLDVTKPYGILAYHCNRYLNNKGNKTEELLNLSELESRINKKEKLIVRNPFE